jgi:hypothetical protein
MYDFSNDANSFEKPSIWLPKVFEWTEKEKEVMALKTGVDIASLKVFQDLIKS